MEGTTHRWSAARVLALAPDASSAAAARSLASAARWVAAGCSGQAVWGSCRGSGAAPYRTVVDLTGPAYRCSCPSRKFPCKHALALLLLWSGGHVAVEEVPDDVSGWLAGRAARVPRAAAADDPATEQARAAAAAHRADQRARRVAAGAAELRRWLEDRVRTGLAGTDRAGYGPLDALAARMVDAQAPGLASWVRRLAGVAASGPGWPEALLREYAMLALLVRAHEDLAALPPPLAATVRHRVGYPTTTAAIIAGQPAVRDTWAVLALRDEADDRLTARRVHLAGASTGRLATILTYAPAGQPLDATFAPGTGVEADLHFYPDAAPLRAVAGEHRGPPGPVPPVRRGTVEQALDGVARVLARDPWSTTWPVVLGAVHVARDEQPSGAPEGAGWRVGDATGSLPLRPRADAPWPLLAVSAGRPVDLVADWTPEGLRPLSVLSTERPVVTL